MFVHLIRHAHAGSRSSWNQPDFERPLSPKGLAQAIELARLDTSGASVFSSPATRCTQTVAPLADALGTQVTVDRRLAEGSDPVAVIEWICDQSHEGDLVLCSHGDILPSVLRLLGLRGMTLDGPPEVRKASTWSCSVVDGRPVHATYRPPPRVEV